MIDFKTQRQPMFIYKDVLSSRHIVLVKCVNHYAESPLGRKCKTPEVFCLVKRLKIRRSDPALNCRCYLFVETEMLSTDNCESLQSEYDISRSNIIKVVHDILKYIIISVSTFHTNSIPILFP